MREKFKHLVAQLPLAASEPLQIFAQDLDHIGFVAPRLARRMGSEEDLLHAPKWRTLGQRLLRAIR